MCWELKKVENHWCKSGLRLKFFMSFQCKEFVISSHLKVNFRKVIEIILVLYFDKEVLGFVRNPLDAQKLQVTHRL